MVTPPWTTWPVATDLDTLLAAEIDRLTPAGRPGLEGGEVRAPRVPTPHYGVVVVLIVAAALALTWWRVLTVEGLAARLGPRGHDGPGSGHRAART